MVRKGWHLLGESNPRLRFWRPMGYHYTKQNMVTGAGCLEMAVPGVDNAARVVPARCSAMPLAPVSGASLQSYAVVKKREAGTAASRRKGPPASVHSAGGLTLPHRRW